MRSTGWFTEDFTLAELRTLRAIERLPTIRPENVKYDRLYPVPTLAEILDLARHSRSCAGRPVGVAPETKHPSYFSGIGLPLEPALLKELTAADLNTGDAPVIIQSFETTNLKQLNRLTDVRLIQLINCTGAPVGPGGGWGFRGRTPIWRPGRVCAGSRTTRMKSGSART